MLRALIIDNIITSRASGSEYESECETESESETDTELGHSR